MNLQPVRAFAGSSYVPEALAFFAASTGSRRAMVAGPSTEESRYVGGFLIALGYEVDTAAKRSRHVPPIARLGGLRTRAGRRGDPGPADPPVDPAIAARRADGGLAGGHRGRGRGRRSRPAGRQGRSADRSDGSSPRQASGPVAGEAAGRLGRTRGRFPEGAPARGGRGARLAGRIGAASLTRFTICSGPRARSWRRWARPSWAPRRSPCWRNWARRPARRPWSTWPACRRGRWPCAKPPLAAFVASTEKHGILLRADEILAQYDRYNQSATADAATQQILGTILDCLEARGKANQPEKKE